MAMFNVFVRPIIEFCAVIYHPLLTITQSNALERMQKQTVKLAYGWNTDYVTVCAAQGIKSLKQRREEYINRFITKAFENPRFSSSWFPSRDEDLRGIRSRRNLVETRAPVSYTHLTLPTNREV